MDTKNIGQDRAIQNPQDALPGTYTDQTHTLPPETKFPLGAQAPDPQPFANLSDPVGPGRGGR